MLERARGTRWKVGTRPVLVLALGLALVTGCGSQSPDDDRATEARDLRADVARAKVDESTDLGAAVQGLARLGSVLSQNLPPDSGSGGNQVFSPLSLAIAFALVREGTDEVAGREIDDVIDLPTNRQAAYSRILQVLQDAGQGNTVEINDGLFVDPDEPIEQSYLTTIQRWYGAGVQQTEFPGPALDVINGWVKERTHGRIPHLLDQLDANAVAALVNTIYLHASWAVPFDKDETRDELFTDGSGERVTAKMMHATERLDWCRGPGFQAVRLPYAGGRLSMWVLLPDDTKADPRELLSPDTLARAVQASRSTQVALSLPRWDTETKASLAQLLQSQGMTSVFQTGHLRPMSPDPKLYVSDVIQQANITVGEKGTIAAAATAVVFEAASGESSVGTRFAADHPFAYAIVHDATGLPLFEGVVDDPTAG